MPPPSASALSALTALMQQGLNGPTGDGAPRSALEAFLAERYHKAHHSRSAIRDAYGRSAEAAHVPFAGVLPADSPASGAYGGMSVVWFPRADGGSLLTFVVGTLGLSPDEGTLGRPGHRRYVQAMRGYVHRRGVPIWAKVDPAAIGAPVPEAVRALLPGWDAVWDRYGPFIYVAAEISPKVPADTTNATVAAFFDLYARERGWKPLSPFAGAFDRYLANLAEVFLRNPDEAEVVQLLTDRRFVVLQGPPGTGKTRMADRIGSLVPFEGRRLPIQFHPAVTYEDFVIGLAPRPHAATLNFHVRAGWLLQAVEGAERSGNRPFLLAIDEINRGDLGKVLGEAIYLFEPGETRQVALPHPWDGRERLTLPENLYVLATMNTADRSIAGMDLAVRRRFAFVTLHPARQPVAAQGLPIASEAFDRLTTAFIEYASDDALALQPGQAFFLARDEAHVKRRFRYELLPLLDEYLTAGLLGAAGPEVQTVRDWLDDRIGG